MIALTLLTDAREACGTLNPGEAYDADEAERDLRRFNRILRNLIVRPLVAKSISANTAGQSGYSYQCDTSAGAITLTLYAGAREGQQFGVADAAGSFGSHALIINPNGRQINGSTGTVNITANAIWFFRSDTANWEKVRDLALADSVYVPDEACAWLVTVLAGNLAPVYGGTFDVKMAVAAEMSLRDRYGHRGGAK